MTEKKIIKDKTTEDRQVDEKKFDEKQFDEKMTDENMTDEATEQFEEVDEEDLSAAGPDEVSGEEKTIEEMAAELAAARQAGKEHEDRCMRLYAEFENYKKRAAREARDFRRFANEELVKEMLPVIDNLERAIQSSSSQEDREDFKKSILEGVTMTLNEILKVLDRFHVKPIEALQTPFDPNFHEAVGQEENDEVADGTVIREYQKGYLLHDRLVRPSMVVVSKAKPASRKIMVQNQSDTDEWDEEAVETGNDNANDEE